MIAAHTPSTSCMRSLSLLCFAVACVSVANLTFAIDDEALQRRYAQGNRLYEQERYGEAIEAYRFVLSQSTNGHVYYNLGNAYLKNGQHGLAIWCYERARLYLPRDRDLKANLAYAKALNEDRFEYPAHPLSLAQIYARLNVDEWTALAAGAYASLAILAVLYLLLERYRRWLRRALMGNVLLLAACLLCLVLKMHHDAPLYAIITAPQVEAYNGAGRHFKPLFILHEGAKVEVLRHREGWLEISTPEERSGWLPRRAVAEI